MTDMRDAAEKVLLPATSSGVAAGRGGSGRACPWGHLQEGKWSDGAQLVPLEGVSANQRPPLVLPCRDARPVVNECGNLLGVQSPSHFTAAGPPAR